MLFKKSWNLFYSNVVGHPVKLYYFFRNSYFTSFSFTWEIKIPSCMHDKPLHMICDTAQLRDSEATSSKATDSQYIRPFSLLLSSGWNFGRVLTFSIIVSSLQENKTFTELLCKGQHIVICTGKGNSGTNAYFLV